MMSSCLDWLRPAGVGLRPAGAGLRLPMELCMERVREAPPNPERLLECMEPPSCSAANLTRQQSLKAAQDVVAASAETKLGQPRVNMG
jgi:hypothetical protein